MALSGRSQRRIAEDLGISQPAVSQQVNAKHALNIDGAPASPEVLLEAAGPYSVIDLLVTPPGGATLEDMSRLRDTIARLLAVDVVSYGGLKPGIDDHILREAVPL